MLTISHDAGIKMFRIVPVYTVYMCQIWNGEFHVVFNSLCNVAGKN